MGNKKIAFDDGVIVYDVNGKLELPIRIADVYLIERIYNAFEELDKKQDEYRKTVESVKDNKALFDAAHKIDEEMRGYINEPFEMDVCSALFDHMSVYAISPNTGMPVWLNFMLAMLDEVQGTVSGAEAKANARLQKYVAKYKK